MAFITSGHVFDIHKELVRCCARYDPQALGYWGLYGQEDGMVEVKLLNGETVRVKGAETVAALRALPGGTSSEEAAKVLLSERAS